jgi:acetylornithine deacetylase/succinyl-diaminopimelate desuccinylase-like protein
LTQFLKQDGKRLQADAVLVSDTEMLGKGIPSIIYGLRGNLNCELEVSGAKHDLHSGRYGGGVLNPLQALSETIASLHDRQERVAIPGFYQRVRALTHILHQYIRTSKSRSKGTHKGHPYTINL